MKTYDFAIIGAGVEGIILSCYLSKLGRSVCLIDSAAKIGGNLKTSALEVFKDDEVSSKALHFIGTELGLDFNYEKTFIEPLTFDKNTFQPFVGFGDEAPHYLDWINAYGAPEQLLSEPAFNETLETLVSKFPVDVLTNSTVTHMEIQENKVAEIILNGKTNLEATHFISTVHPLKMEKWNKDLLPPRFVQKINKSTLWTTLALTLTHSQIPNTHRGWYILRGNKTDWFVGHFSKTGSQWLAFISSENENDPEITAQLFKEIKKAISKAFPELLTKITFEKLSVLSQSHGQIPFKMNQENPFQSIKNLWVCTGMATNSHSPVVASVLASQELLMDLQIHGYIENMPKINNLDDVSKNETTL